MVERLRGQGEQAAAPVPSLSSRARALEHDVLGVGVDVAGERKLLVLGEVLALAPVLAAQR
eukprot:1139019-Pleurochrysis_carterae.AAC.1